MNRTIRLLALLLLPAIAHAQNAPPEVSLKLASQKVEAGKDFKATVTVKFGAGLHGYQNPPTETYMIPVVVKAGDGTTLKSVSYPKGTMEMVAGTMSAVYTGSVDIPVVLTAPGTLGDKKFNITVSYQQCDDQQCYMPSSVDTSATATIVAAKATSGSGTATTTPPTPPAPRTAHATVSYQGPQTAESGKSVEGTLTIVVPKGDYIYSSDQTLVAVSEKNGLDVKLGEIKGGTTRTFKGAKRTVYEGTVSIPVTIGPIATAGETKFELSVAYTLWDDQGPFEPSSDTVAGSVQVAEPQPVTTSAPAATQSAKQTQTESPSSSGTSGGLLGFLNNALSSGNWLLIIPAALLAGLALCLTPCVFPMIPVTVSFFSNQGSKTTGGRFSLGFFYMLGIAVTYGAVGGVSAAASGAVGELFTKQWFVLALAALLIALALSMFDLYEIRLPTFIQKNLKGRSGPVGALIMGLLMGFAAAPCAGALVGAVAVKVAEIGSVPTGLGFFGAIGVGMGLPFMVLATVSSGAKALPKSGGWLKTTKAVLGLIVLYIAADYLFQGVGLKPGEASTQIAWMLVFAAFLVYLLFLDNSDATKAVSRIKGVTAVALGVLGGMAYSSYQKIRFDEQYAQLLKQQGGPKTDSQIVGQNINWILYNDDSFAKAAASGKPIMIDGRADWCKICHELEDRVFNTPEGLVALSNVYLLEIDWSTNVPEAYKDMTKKRFNISGLPHVVFMKPGGKDEFSVNDIKDVNELKEYLRRAGAKL